MKKEMKKERLEVLEKLRKGIITSEQADKELWDLFSLSCRLPKPHGRRIEFANYYIKRYSPQFGLDKKKLKEFMINFLSDEWMCDPNKSYI